jgi:hypothetical protein
LRGRRRSAVAVSSILTVVAILVIGGAVGAIYLTNTPAFSSDSTVQGSQISSLSSQKTDETSNTTTATVERTTTGTSSTNVSLPQLFYRVNFGVTPAAAGEVVPTQQLNATGGSVIMLSAHANTDFVFASWVADNASIVFLCSTCTSTNATIGGDGTIEANFVPQNGTAYVSQVCAAHGLGGEDSISCVLGAEVNDGQALLVEAAVQPGANITDSLHDGFSLIGNTTFPGSTYILEVFYATASQTGPDTVNITGSGGFAAIGVQAIKGTTGLSSALNDSGTSSSPQVRSFEPRAGSLIVAAVLIHNDVGVFNTTVAAGAGYGLITVGPDITDEYAISSGRATTSPFELQSPEDWAEVSVVFST